jgi:predicted kinase
MGSRHDMEMVVFMGVQASGKSTFFKDKFYNTHVRISLDVVNTRNREDRLIETCLDIHQPLVIDNTNTYFQSREKYLKLANERKIKVVGYVFYPDLENSLRRNSYREGSECIPNTAIISTYRKMEMPSFSEGFDEIFLVTTQDEYDDFDVEPYLEDVHKDIKKEQPDPIQIIFDLSEYNLSSKTIESTAYAIAIEFGFKFFEVDSQETSKVKIEMISNEEKIDKFKDRYIEKLKELRHQMNRMTKPVQKAVHIQGLELKKRESKIRSILLRYPGIEFKIFDYSSGIFGALKDTFIYIRGLEEQCEDFGEELVINFPKATITASSLSQP